MDEASRIDSVDYVSIRGDELRPSRRRREIVGKSCSMSARLTTSTAASERLLALVGTGTESFILVSGDGRVSIRVQLSIEAIETTEHQFAEGTMVVDWGRSIVSNGESRIALPR